VNAQGITVHGWWTIKVIDHGAVVASREFENSLGANGSAALNALLASKGSINPNFGWWVQLDSSTGIRPCKATLVGSPVQQPCNPGATVSTPTSGAQAGKLVLSGSVTADPVGGSGQIDKVSTVLNLCLEPTIAQCTFVAGGIFTATSITPIPVQSTQSVQFTVVISFS
jgi:hypothetical protein